MAGHYFSTVENNVTGKPVSGATIKVYEAGATISGDAITSGTFATIYSDDGVTTVNQAGGTYVTSNARGLFQFWTDQSSVDIEISYDGVAKVAISDVEIVGGDVSGDVTALAARVDKHDTVFGLSASATDLGTFTGSTITDNTDVKSALQEIETAVEAASIGLREVPTFNFTADGEARFYADVAMTLTEQGTSGTGTQAYEKSTAAAPGTFSSTTSPITLEAGAWLKVSASSVSTLFAVALKRTA